MTQDAIISTGSDHLPKSYVEATLQSLSPFSAAGMEIARSNKIDGTVPRYIACISAPVMLLKQYINVVQLVTASQWLAEGDKKDRKRRE